MLPGAFLALRTSKLKLRLLETAEAITAPPLRILDLQRRQEKLTAHHSLIYGLVQMR